MYSKIKTYFLFNFMKLFLQQHINLIKNISKNPRIKENFNQSKKPYIYIYIFVFHEFGKIHIKKLQCYVIFLGQSGTTQLENALKVAIKNEDVDEKHGRVRLVQAQVLEVTKGNYRVEAGPMGAQAGAQTNCFLANLFFWRVPKAIPDAKQTTIVNE